MFPCVMSVFKAEFFNLHVIKLQVFNAFYLNFKTLMQFILKPH